jgi:tetratricopeptide (TPR) repeat protein
VAYRLGNLAIVAQNMGDLKLAETLYIDALKRQEHIYGDRHPETAAAKANYGLLLQREGRLSEAEPLLRSALDARLSLNGPNHFLVGYFRVSLAILLHDKGDLAASESEFRQALAIYDKALPENHQYRAALLMHFARLLVDRKKSAEALAKSEESIKIWTATSPASNPQTALAHAIHAYALEHLGKFPQAADELSAALPVLVKARGTDDAVVRRAQGWQKIADPNALQALSTSVTVHRP